MTNAQKRALKRQEEQRPAYAPNVTLCQVIELDVPVPLMQRLRKLKANIESRARMPHAPMRAFAMALLESAIDREELALEQAREAESIIVKPTAKQVQRVVLS